MPTLMITKRRTRAGELRYVVRYRLGGRAYPVKHAGSFPTLKRAKARRDLIGGEIAAGRNPVLVLEQLRDPATQRTFRDWAQAYRDTRIDVAATTKAKIRSHLAAILPAFGDKVPDNITPADVQAWITSSDLKPSSLRRYIATLRLIFDYIGTQPNPARDSRVRLPRASGAPVEPPSGDEVAAIIAAATPRAKLILRVLAETGMRVGETCALQWRDVDLAEIRFRIRDGKTAAARRWVTVPEAVMLDVGASTPPDDREPDRHVFPGVTGNAVLAMMTRACERAGTAHYTPHSLRHRWASVQIAKGVPVPQVAAHLGHSKKSLTLDTYSHVLIRG